MPQEFIPEGSLCICLPSLKERLEVRLTHYSSSSKPCKRVTNLLLFLKPSNLKQWRSCTPQKALLKSVQRSQINSFSYEIPEKDEFEKKVQNMQVHLELSCQCFLKNITINFITPMLQASSEMMTDFWWHKWSDKVERECKSDACAEVQS